VGEWWDDGSVLRRSTRLAAQGASVVGASAVQIAECLVGGRPVAVVISHGSGLNSPQRDAVARRVRDAVGAAVVACLVDSRVGRCELEPSLVGSGEEAAVAAMAAAVVMASWGWDESSHIAVQIGSTTLSVEPAFASKIWTARFRR
jgi:hypothetical protein